MAGFLVTWTSDGGLPDAQAWAQAQSTAARFGAQIHSHQAASCAVLAWHRSTGEFAHSGKIFPLDGKHIAWLGQCVDDAGEASHRAMPALAQDVWSDAAVARLNGPFAAVVIGHAPFSVRVVTDRYRHYPVYVYKGARVTAASTDMRCLLPFMSRRALNLAAVDMLLRSGELIDKDTLLEGVELLPPGTVLCAASQESGSMRTTEHRYWAMRHDGSSAPSIACTADDLAQRLTTAVRRLEAVTPRLGITLSGGLDSRIILDLCRHPEQVPSFTWGLPGCRDIACASQYAQAVHSPHTVKHWEPAAFPSLWSKGVDLTAGSFGIDSMHMLPFVPLLAAHCDVVLNGLAGDAILGGNFMKHEWLRETDALRMGSTLWRWRVTEAEDRLVDGLAVRSRGLAPAGQRWASSVAAREGARPIERANDWLYENRVFRNTNAGTQLLRSGVESHSPFFDNDFVDAVTAVRQEHKFKHRLYLEVIRRAAPRAAAVTWQRTNIPPAWGYHANFAAMALHRIMGKLASPMGMELFKSLKVADPAAWLRAEWRTAVEAILFSPQAMQRGVWNADAARALWQAHTAGANHTRQLAAMVSVELFAQQVLDGGQP
jgi:asparagine synthetase B (glutamine-hydrolysing)